MSLFERFFEETIAANAYLFWQKLFGEGDDDEGSKEKEPKNKEEE